MQRLLSLVCLSVLPLAVWADMSPASARAGRAARSEVARQQRDEIQRLMGDFSWGINRKEVIALLEEEIRSRYAPQLQETVGDALAYDRLRREMSAKVEEMKAGQVVFDGQRTPWDVSLISGQFGHKNNESMLVSWGERDRRFFFFFNDRLWKIYIAFNADVFADKTFDDFAALMEARLGLAERKLTVNLTGQEVVDHLAWPIVGGTGLRAVDQTGFFGNFCLLLIDEATRNVVEAGRVAQRGAVGRKTDDPLVRKVTREGQAPSTVRNPHEDIVDRITGTRVETPTERDTHRAGDAAADKKPPATKKPTTPPATSDPAPRKKPKRSSTGDPLRDLDF